MNIQALLMLQLHTRTRTTKLVVVMVAAAAAAACVQRALQGMPSPVLPWGIHLKQKWLILSFSKKERLVLEFLQKVVCVVLHL